LNRMELRPISQKLLFDFAAPHLLRELDALDRAPNVSAASGPPASSGAASAAALASSAAAEHKQRDNSKIILDLLDSIDFHEMSMTELAEVKEHNLYKSFRPLADKFTDVLMQKLKYQNWRPSYARDEQRRRAKRVNLSF